MARPGEPRLVGVRGVVADVAAHRVVERPETGDGAGHAPGEGHPPDDAGQRREERLRFVREGGRYRLDLDGSLRPAFRDRAEARPHAIITNVAIDV